MAEDCWERAMIPGKIFVNDEILAAIYLEGRLIEINRH
jgi:hypothetical protein